MQVTSPCLLKGNAFASKDERRDHKFIQLILLLLHPRCILTQPRCSCSACNKCNFSNSSNSNRLVSRKDNSNSKHRCSSNNKCNSNRPSSSRQPSNRCRFKQRRCNSSRPRSTPPSPPTKWSVFLPTYTGGIPQWLNTDRHSVVTAKMSTAL